MPICAICGLSRVCPWDRSDSHQITGLCNPLSSIPGCGGFRNQHAGKMPATSRTMHLGSLGRWRGRTDSLRHNAKALDMAQSASVDEGAEANGQLLSGVANRMARILQLKNRVLGIALLNLGSICASLPCRKHLQLNQLNIHR